jgi:hypothetical protein
MMQTSVFTSQDSYIWERDARYFYYLHGPMARMELGEDKVQGQDYIYTMQGWIKAVNLPGIDNHLFEPGKDGNTEGVNRYNARDEMSYVLAYNEKDYKPIDNSLMSGNKMGKAYETFWSSIKASVSPTPNDAAPVKGLFNGNIAAMMTYIRKFEGYNDGSIGVTGDAGKQQGLMASVYHYDALHRIRKSFDYNFYAWGGVSANGEWQKKDATGQIGNNKTEYSYDGNGNILTLKRWNNGVAMDNVSYFYNRKAEGSSTVECSTDATKKITNNQLCQVTDAQADILVEGKPIDEP